MYDQEKKKARGFGFLSFENDAAVDGAVAEHYVNIQNKQVEIICICMCIYIRICIL